MEMRNARSKANNSQLPLVRKVSGADEVRFVIKKKEEKVTVLDQSCADRKDENGKSDHT